MKQPSPLSGDALAELHETYMTAPSVQKLGIEFGQYHDDGGVTLTLPLREHHMNGAGVVHGGVVFTLADSAVSYGIARTAGCRCTTVEAKINYLRPVVAGILTARGHVVRVGRSLVVARGEVRCDGIQVAEMLTTFFVLE